LGGISELASGSAEQEKLDAYIKQLGEQKTRYAEEARKRKMDLFRMNEAQKKQTLTRANQKAAQNGMDEVASSYSNEEGLDNGLNNNLAQLDAETNQVMRSFDDKIAAAGLQMPNESGMEKFMGGAIAGGNIGLSFANILKDPNPSKKPLADNPVDAGKQINPGLKVDSPIQPTDNKVNFLDGINKTPENITLKLGDGNSNPWGGLGDNSNFTNDPAGMNDLGSGITDKPWKKKYSNFLRLGG
jgi:hypothetical protein